MLTLCCDSSKAASGEACVLTKLISKRIYSFFNGDLNSKILYAQMTSHILLHAVEDIKLLILVNLIWWDAVLYKFHKY